MLQDEATAEKKVTFSQDYNKKRGPSHWSGNWTRWNDDNGAMILTPDLLLEETSGQAIRILTNLDKTDFSTSRLPEKQQ